MSSLCRTFHPQFLILGDTAQTSNFHISLLPSKPHLSCTRTACVLAGGPSEIRFSVDATTWFVHCLGASSWPVCMVRWWPCAATIYTKSRCYVKLKCMERNSQVAWILRSKWAFVSMSDRDRFVGCNLKGRFEEACPSCPSHSVLAWRQWYAVVLVMTILMVKLTD